MNYLQHRNTMELETAWPPGRKPRNCADARYLAKVWPKRAFVARKTKEKWVERTLVELAYDGRRDPWPLAVRQVQKLFPGTEGWLLSCSDAEGWEPGRLIWVVFGGDPYTPGAENDYNGRLPQVGGPMQYMYGTFRGHYRHALEYVQEKGYRVPRHLVEVSVTAWRSALAQALAAGWARYTGEDNNHWSASWSNGCR
jgi:hypothetical protein